MPRSKKGSLLKKRAKNELLSRMLVKSTKIDKTSTSIKPPKKLKNSLPKGKRKISRRRRQRTKFV